MPNIPQEKVKRLKQLIKHMVKRDERNAKRVATLPQPLYDELFWKFREWLDRQ